MKTPLLILIFLVGFLYSCKKDSKKEIEMLVTEWQGKEVLFPENIVFTTLGKDTVDFNFTDTEYKILVYTDSIGCTNCKLQLINWKEIISEFDSIIPQTVSFLFFFHPANLREVRLLLKRDKFEYPIAIDLNNELSNKNHFPDNVTFQTFLLNKENRVVAIGNPVLNTKVKELYLRKILDVSEPVSEFTKIDISETLLDLGKFKSAESQFAKIKIKNIEDVPFFIESIDVSCGCVVPYYSKQPIRKNEEMILKIKYEAESVGVFQKTLTMHCNVKDSPILINVQGVAQ